MCLADVACSPAPAAIPCTAERKMAEEIFSHMDESSSVKTESDNNPQNRLFSFCKAAVEEMDSKIIEFKEASRDKDSLLPGLHPPDVQCPERPCIWASSGNAEDSKRCSCKNL